MGLCEPFQKGGEGGLGGGQRPIFSAALVACEPGEGGGGAEGGPGGGGGRFVTAVALPKRVPRAPGLLIWLEDLITRVAVLSTLSYLTGTE